MVIIMKPGTSQEAIHALVEKLAEDFAFEYQAVLPDGETAIRLVTSWATREADVQTFLNALPQNN